MRITHDWLRAKIAEPEPESCEAGGPSDRVLAVEIQRLRDLENDEHDMLRKLYEMTLSDNPAATLACIRDELGTFLYGATLDPNACPDCEGSGEGQTNSSSYSDIPLCPTCKGSGTTTPLTRRNAEHE